MKAKQRGTPRRSTQGNQHKPLWSTSILTQPEAEEAVATAMEEVLGIFPSSYTDVETQQTRVTAYLTREPAPRIRVELAARLQNIKACGLRVDPGRILIQRVRREDWAESWKRHFPAIEIGSALLLKPTWIRQRPRAGQSVVVLDPGLSFGTGQHPTTAFCLGQLVKHRPKRGESRAFLDIGTGSGVLAIAAAKLGYVPVEAFDFDPESIRVARENAQLNDAARQLHLFRADLTKLPPRGAKRFDVICANLISTLLMSEAPRIVKRLKPGGVLVLAGILDREFDEVSKRFESLGLTRGASRRQKEWRSGSFHSEP